MFVKKSEFERLKKHVEKLSGYSHKDFERLDKLDKQVEKLNDEVLPKDDNYFYASMLSFYSTKWSSGDQTKQPEKLSLRKEVDQLKELIGAKEVVTSASRKLVIKKPTKKGQK